MLTKESKQVERPLPQGEDCLAGALVLVVDDSSENRQLAHVLLKKRNAEVRLAVSGREALDLLEQGFSPDLILLDIMMPEIDGFAVLEKLKSQPETRDIPVILLTALDNSETETRGFRAGAADYLTKPINAGTLISRVSVQIELKRARETLLRQQVSLQEEIARQVEQSRLLESQLQIALESSSFLVWRLDVKSSEMRFSMPVTGLLGYEWNTIGLARYLDLVHPEDRAVAANVASPDILSHEIGDYRLRHADGSWVWVEVRSKVIDPVTGLTVGTISDLSARKAQEQVLAENLMAQRQLNKKLEEAHNQLLQSEKMASIGQLAAGVAHELNNPIGFVYSNLGTLDNYLHDLMEIIGAFISAAETTSSPSLAEAMRLCQTLDLEYIRKDIFDLLAESKDGLERLRKIVLDLKSFSRVGEQEWQEADVHQGLDSTLNIVWNELKYKCTIEKEYGDIPAVYCLISQLNQVFMNLLVNAGQAIEKQGKITIRTYLKDKDHVAIEIQDTGKGIPAENLNRVFEPFFTTKPVGKGTGLGLSLSYAIVERHQGELSVTSEVGKGSTFTITLPIHPSVVEAENNNKEPS